jgi:hypothetical protein
MKSFLQKLKYIRASDREGDLLSYWLPIEKKNLYCGDKQNCCVALYEYMQKCKNDDSGIAVKMLFH